MTLTKTPEAAHTRAAMMQDEARNALRKALESRQTLDGRVTFPARDADRIARACTELKPVEANSRKPRERLLLTTGGVPRAVAELEKLSDLPEPVAGQVTAAIQRCRVALKLRNAALRTSVPLQDRPTGHTGEL